MSPEFSAWFDEFAQEALAQGVAPATIHKIAPSLTYDESVIELDRKQPETQITFARYLQNTMPDNRIKKARALVDEYSDTLEDIAASSGVPTSIIVALWGMESSFGAGMGDYDVVNSLATLAFEGRRAELFRKELIEALHILEEENRSPESLIGSWAGAMGQCQFMPSTYRKFAVDYNHDGVRDIWNDPQDALASIGNYLAAEGWQAGLGWGREVKLTHPIAMSEVGLEVRKTMDAWTSLGVRSAGGKSLPDSDSAVSLIQPDGPSGRSFLVTDNFRAIMRWNRSTFFATTVGLFADRIAGRY